MTGRANRFTHLAELPARGNRLAHVRNNGRCGSSQPRAGASTPWINGRKSIRATAKLNTIERVGNGNAMGMMRGGRSLTERRLPLAMPFAAPEAPIFAEACVTVLAKRWRSPHATV